MKLPDALKLDSDLRPIAQTFLDIFPWVVPYEKSDFSSLGTMNFQICPHPNVKIAVGIIGTTTGFLLFDSEGFLKKETFALGNQTDTVGLISFVIGKLTQQPPKEFLYPLKMFLSETLDSARVHSPSSNAFRDFQIAANAKKVWKPSKPWNTSPKADSFDLILSTLLNKWHITNKPLPGIPMNIAEALSQSLHDKE
jgi:hypothetical protein